MVKTSLETTVADEGDKLWHLLFERSPASFSETEVLCLLRNQRAYSLQEGKVGAVRLVHNELMGPPGARSAQATTRTRCRSCEASLLLTLASDIECGLVVVSVGYQGESIDSNVSFDAKSGTIPNVDGDYGFMLLSSHSSRRSGPGLR